MNKAILSLFMAVGFLVYCFPTAEGHASCKLAWTWSGVNCSYIKSQIVAQMNKWSTNPCTQGEKCKYKITSQTDTQIKGTHTTPVHDYVDDLTMDFVDSGNSCTVDGYSTSELWYAILDYGTNYCNLHNIVTGAGLDKVYSFSEKTSDSDCTQYSSADCDKY